MLPPPKGQHADRTYGRDVICQLALNDGFDAVVAEDPARRWEGDEAAFWPLRVEAVRAGWQPDEVDRALLALAALRSGRRSRPANSNLPPVDQPRGITLPFVGGGAVALAAVMLIYWLG